MFLYSVQIVFLEESMEKLDLKDRKILYYLDIDSRQSFSQLGKKVGLRKDVVNYRVKKLQEKGIIKGFFTVINYPKIGLSAYRFYFSVQNITPKLKKEIIDYFINIEYVGAVRTIEGSYDLLVIIYVKNYLQAHAFWQKTLKQYGKYFLKKIFSAFFQVEDYAKSFLFDEKDNIPKIVHQWSDSGNIVEIDDLDNQIIRLISQNSRLPTIEIAKSINKKSRAVHNRLRKLMELDIIIAHRLHIDFQKIGYFFYKVDIELNHFDKLDNIIKYIKSNPNFVYFCKTIGYVDLEIGFCLNNSYQLNQIMEKLLSKFPDAIKNYTYFSTIKIYKNYMSILDLHVD